MTWTIEWDDRARKELRQLDCQVQREFLNYLRNRIASDEDPRRFGKQLLRDKKGLWRYRYGSYRMICSIEDFRLVVLVVKVGHRSSVYK